MKYLIPFLVILISCSPEQTQTAPTVTPTQNSKRSEISEKPYANPVLIFGSSFGNYIQQLWRINRYEDMVKFTSRESRKKFGDEKLKGFYEHEFHFDFQLNKLTAIQKSGDTSFLIYSNAFILGTRRKVVLETVTNNDTVQLVLNSLK